MELDKRKYKQKEVKELLEANSFEYKSKIDGQKERIDDLIKENQILSQKLEYYENKKDSIFETLEKANETAKETDAEIDVYYQSIVDSLIEFSAKWSMYFASLKDKYPVYPVVKEATDLKDKLDKLLNSGEIDNKSLVDNLSSEIQKRKVFNPRQKIEDFIAVTSDNGFSLEEVLNPGELQLEDLCKELGLMEENE